MEYFVHEDSIVRKIWSKADTIMFIFAGSAAEFALNKAVDWLYFTGRLPTDPIGRLFSTVTYSQQIIFAERRIALQAIANINAIHNRVEDKRGTKIPDWAFRDVLFMLIDYSIRSFELLERKLTAKEKQAVLEVFNDLGHRMGIEELPGDFISWEIMRQEYKAKDLVCSKFTADLYKQYRKHLGWLRYQILLQAQVLVVPRDINNLLALGNIPFLKPLLFIYKVCRFLNLQQVVKNVVLPSAYKKQIADLDQLPAHSG